jgi:O-acetyl-ADP-ribose deacetylase (regulator of RNase III)
MARGTSVFICYKKFRESEDDQGGVIRYEDSKAEIIHHILEASGRYDAWRDESDLPAGSEWERTIYEQLSSRDVVLLLVSNGTSKSVWVNRELALAQALGISIVPLVYGIDGESMETELKELGVWKLQGKPTQNIHLGHADALLAEIGPSLDNAKERTRANRKLVLERLLAADRVRRAPAASNQRAASFEYGAGPLKCTIHIAAGDVAKVRGVDIMVNSENNWMQMARFFERRTVSSLLRHAGSRVVGGGVFEDTVQQELDWQLRKRARPVPATAVIPTSAGAPGSVLADYNRARYIFHVAAVQAVDAENRVVPYKQPHQIEGCVKNCLRTIAELIQADGVISPPDTEQRAVQQKHADQGFRIRSIVFPLFATGDGGVRSAEVIDSMVTGLTEYLDDPGNRDVAEGLEDIYISVFLDDDVAVVRSALAEAFGPAL